MTAWLALLGWTLAFLLGAAWWRARRERDQVRARLEAEQRWFPELLDRLGIAHWRRNLDTQALWWSDVFRRMHGIRPDEPAERERSLRQIVPEDRERVREALEAAYARGGGEAGYRIQQPDGRITHHMLRIVVTREPATGQRLAMGINLDISERVQLEAMLRERTAYLEAIVQHLPMGLSVFDRDLKLRVWNAEFGRVLGLPDELLREGVDFDDLIRVPAQRGEYGDEDPQQAVARRRALALQFRPHRLERTRPNGRMHLVIGEPIVREGAVVGFVTTYTDITEQKQERERLAQAHDILRTLVDNIPVGVSMVDRDLRVQVWNERLLELLELPRALFEQPGLTLVDVLRFNIARGEYGPQADPEAALAEMRARALRFEPHEFERVRPNGRVLHVRGQPLATGGFVTVYADVTERRAAQVAIERLARTDALTGLTNRHALPVVLDQALRAAERDQRPLALLFIDLDRFKAVNDSLGHEAGDRVLVEAAQRLRARLRGSDIVARIGGDEFVVALTGVQDEADAARVAEQIVQALSEPFALPEGAVGANGAGEGRGTPRTYLTPSIGIALAPRDGHEAQELLRLADIAMYHAKADGGAGWRYYTPAMQEAIARRIDLESRLREAIAADALALHYQPIHTLGDGMPLVGFEALLRWPQPDGSVLLPGAFVPVAEQSAELVEALGSWVCRAVARQRHAWQQAHTGGPLLISINLSARQFDREGLAGRIRDAFDRAVPADARRPLPLLGIEFEITESVMMRDPQRAEAELARLRELGARIAIDDFGTGYSSLSYLKHLPIDRLKIDRAFVRDLAHDADDAAIVGAAVTLAHQLGREAVAEGVESAQQLAALRDLGCDAVQGFGLGRPMPAADVPAYVARVARGEHLALWDAADQLTAATRSLA
ncbi:MAG: EAL domain-containing protein [Pseudomonadota bacterium]